MRAQVDLAPDIARLVVACDDRPGIVARISSFLFDAGANIVASEQYSTDPEGGRFFLRVEFHRAGIREERAALEEAFARDVARPLELEWRLVGADQRKRMGVLVSRHAHCLVDLLWRTRQRDVEADLSLVISNHDDLREEVERFDVPYHHVPVAPGGKPEAERRMLELLRGTVDFVVLARYMQILSGGFLDALDVPVINIHHSFLPAFAGADPYRRARERGVKIIGATAHYVTEELDAGPIVEQDVARVSHAVGAAGLERIGRDIERTVLGRAVGWHAEDRVFVDATRTVVFKD
jgi:formyltetrahydrofolate deformylase